MKKFTQKDRQWLHSLVQQAIENRIELGKKEDRIAKEVVYLGKLYHKITDIEDYERK